MGRTVPDGTAHPSVSHLGHRFEADVAVASIKQVVVAEQHVAAGVYEYLRRVFRRNDPRYLRRTDTGRASARRVVEAVGQSRIRGSAGED
jgi:hypothetical protein